MGILPPRMKSHTGPTVNSHMIETLSVSVGLTGEKESRAHRRSHHCYPTKTPKAILLHFKIMTKIFNSFIHSPISKADLICVPNATVYGHLTNRALESSNKT